MRWKEIQGAQGVENAEATSLASGRNADGSDARYFFVDASDHSMRESLSLPAHQVSQLTCDSKCWYSNLR